MKQQLNDWMTIFQNNDAYNLSSCIKISHSNGDAELINIDSADSKYYNWGGFTPILDIVKQKESEGWVVFSNTAIGSTLGYPFTLFFTLKKAVLIQNDEPVIAKKEINKVKTSSKKKKIK